ncbi:MAG: hypothetical protein GWO24_19185 [Akkermansiaceae bacterium]|nr:hypothetical protein [Akkermansiaceae bacterium]
MDSLPPDAKKASIWAHTVVDVVGIAAVTLLMFFGKIDVNVGLVIIALIVGVWARMQKGGSRIPPSGGLILGLVEGFGEWLRS